MSQSNQLKAALLLELVALLNIHGSPLEFKNELVGIADPEIQADDNGVSANGIFLDPTGDVLVSGDIYEGEEFITHSEPVIAKLLTCEELEKLLDAAKRAAQPSPKS